MGDDYAGFAIVLVCCCLVGCSSRQKDAPEDTADVASASSITFLEQQRRLFYEVDHRAVYQACQQLMQWHREGRLSAGIYYCDDPPAKLSELPEPLRKLQPTLVLVDEIMLQMTFRSDDGMQHLQCMSNEFGEPVASDGEAKGVGFRTNPYAMDRLSGTESLDYLNANYKHFEISLIPGLTYQVFDDDPPQTLVELKRSSEGADTMFTLMWETMSELAVKKQRLLFRTDHHALLRACRESIRRFNEGAFSTAKIDILPEELLDDVKYIDREKYAQDLKQIPQIILDLEPVYLWFERNRVQVALIGGLDHAGIIAYLNDEDAVPRDDDMELIDGLRYYDDGLREAGEEYREYLRSLEREAIPPIDWQRKQMNLPIPERSDSSSGNEKQ